MKKSEARSLMEKDERGSARQRFGARRRFDTRERLGVLVLCLLSVMLWSCDSFSFSELLSGTGAHGPGGGPLAISPLSTTVVVSQTVAFTASGGTPPYRFSVTSVPASGTIDSGTGVYRAPSVPSADTIQVSDAAGATAEARALSVY